MMLAVVMEKKQNSIKQTAAKIKTKIHNTSSFFKLSLKTNNKALALALVAQKQRSRQLEMELARLQKDMQSVSFDLAIQRHKNKQMFTVLREFYNTSINCMAKAVDLISKEKTAESLDLEITDDAFQTEKDLTALLPELKNRTSVSKCAQQKNVQGSSVNMSIINDRQPRNSSPKSRDKPPSAEVDYTVPQNTFYDSEMEITVVDNVAEIVTVQTKPKKSCERDQGRYGENNESCSSRSRESIVLNYGKAVVGSSHLNNTTEIASVGTSSETQLQTSTSTCTSTSGIEEESLPQQLEPLCGEGESVTARRKTHVTCRYPKSNRGLNSQKHTAGNPHTRNTYIISPHYSSCISNNDDLDDFFSDHEVQNQRRSKDISYDVNFLKDKGTESEAEIQKPQNDSANNRKTYVIPHKSRPLSRKTKVLSFSMDQSVLPAKESSELIDAHTLNADTDVKKISVHTEKRQSKRSVQPFSQKEECNTLRNRGTYVIHTSRISVCSDVLNDTIDSQADVTAGETANTMTLESTHEAQYSTVIREGQQTEEEVSHVLENRGFLKHSMVVGDGNLLETSSQHSPIGHTKAKKPRTNVMIKERKKNAVARKKVSGNRRHKCSSTQNGELTEGLHSSAFEEAFMGEPTRETTHTDSTMGTINDRGINLKDVSPKHKNNKDHKSKCRETYAVLSNCNLRLEGKENNTVFNSSCEESLVTNRESELSIVTHRSNDNQSTPRKTEQLGQKQSGLFAEERPPWESLDFASTGSFTYDSPVTHQKDLQEISSRTMDIYEEPGWNMSHQSSDGRAMKSLTNTDLTANAPGRSRRKAAPVSYKEPPLNCKMRRGDKFSDTRFLRSPVFKDERKKKLKKNKE